MKGSGRDTGSSGGELPLSYATTILLGAFLLFQVQPLIGKYLLPWFGGSIEVWTTCMLFFQVMLLLGYLYAHLSNRLLPLKAQTILHGVVLLGAIAFIPVMPADHWQPTKVTHPALHILLVLLVTTGLPFFALAATSPLLQSWITARRPKKEVYRLYALSNAGSLLALVSYPFLVEPYFARQTQSWAWSAGLIVFVVLCLLCAKPLWEPKGETEPSVPVPLPAANPTPSASLRKARISKAGKARTPVSSEVAPVGRIQAMLFWLLLPASASMMLLASTNMICLEVASFPFLWVLPLTVYLLTFILCFAGERWYPRSVFIPLAVLSSLGVFALRYDWIATSSINLTAQVLLYVAAMFACCMVCHGETYRLRPAPQKLTSFYLLISCGGALGGFMVAIVAPLAFPGYWELYIAMPLCLALGISAIRPTERWRIPHWRAYQALCVGVLLCVAVLMPSVEKTIRLGDETRTLERARNFYGVLRVLESTVTPRHDRPDVELTMRQVWNGPINHGGQVYDVRVQKERANLPTRSDHPLNIPSAEQVRALPTTYYGPKAGGGIAMQFRPNGPSRPRKIGIVGLGAGTLALYGKPGDTIRYFEINPEVPIIADKYFTFLSDCRRRGVDLEIVMGDGRLSLQKEPSNSLDVLVVDAFSGDAIPVHMLTKEAFELYLDRLRDGGVLSIHVSNRHLHLKWVVVRIAKYLRVPVAIIENWPGQGEQALVKSTWLLLSRNPRLLENPSIKPHLVGDQAGLDEFSLWTDDFSSLLEALWPPLK
jgi:MFS family permease